MASNFAFWTNFASNCSINGVIFSQKGPLAAVLRTNFSNQARTIYALRHANLSLESYLNPHSFR